MSRSGAQYLLTGAVPGSVLESGRYYAQPITTVANTVATDGQLMLSSLFLPRQVTLDRIATQIQSAGTVGSVVRLGVYRDNGLGEPSALALDAGTVDGTSTASQAITISLLIGPGLIWIGGVAQGTPGTNPTYRGRTGGTWLGASAPNTGGAATAPSQNGYVQTAVAGALPDPFVNQGNTNSSIIVAVRVA